MSYRKIEGDHHGHRKFVNPQPSRTISHTWTIPVFEPIIDGIENDEYNLKPLTELLTRQHFTSSVEPEGEERGFEHVPIDRSVFHVEDEVKMELQLMLMINHMVVPSAASLCPSKFCEVRILASPDNSDYIFRFVEFRAQVSVELTSKCERYNKTVYFIPPTPITDNGYNPEHCICQSASIYHKTTYRLAGHYQTPAAAEATSFTVKCSIDVHERTDAYYNILEGISALRLLKKCNLRSDLESLRQKGETDIKIKCKNDKIVSAFSCMLMVQSEVFMAMLTHDMKEKKEKIINIDDIEQEIVEAFIKFMHQGTLEGIDETLMPELLSVANRYQVKNLTFDCEKILMKNVEKYDWIDFLHMADDCNSKLLKSFGLNFIPFNEEEIKEMEEFKTLKEESPKLAEEILQNAQMGVVERMKRIYEKLIAYEESL